MRIIDLSQPLFHQAPNCPAHPPVKITADPHTDGGENSWHMEHLAFTSHTGSHVDAPLHKIKSGRPIDAFPLDAWTGPARILDLRPLAPDAAITTQLLIEKLHSAPIAHHWLLLCTGWGNKRAATDEWLHHAPTLAPEAARWLVTQNAQGVGIDHWSIGNAETHAALLAPRPHPVLIVEELHFPDEALQLQQPAEFWALPINLRAHSGAPCRPVLVLR